MNPLKPILIGLTGVGLLFFGLSFGNEGLEPYRWFCLLLAVVALSFAPNSRLQACGKHRPPQPILPARRSRCRRVRQK